MAKTATEKLKDKLRQRKQPDTPLAPSDFLSSGSTLLNLAATGRTNGCFFRGGFFWLVGDSASGKTFLALTCFAEACRNPNFKDYRLIYDASENGALMNMSRFFGKEMAARTEPPATDANGPVYSSSTEEFYYHVDDALEIGPFIYVLDSMDALTTEEETEKFAQRKKADRAGKEVTGSYGTAKAKMNSQGIRQLLAKLKKTGSILIIISQTRDNIGFGAMFQPKRASGGRALRFYAQLEIWSSIKKRLQNKGLEQGIVAKLEVKKNRVLGRDRVVEVPILHSHGIDETGSLIDWLEENKHLDVTKGRYTGFGYENLSYEKLIATVEQDEREAELRGFVSELWEQQEQASAVQRKSRYNETLIEE